ncbi:MAG: MarR family transcriptional regulator [Acidobacteriota bacterium]|nr:MarR family transcriptional regulator [Acidobacteriota bacterium]
MAPHEAIEDGDVARFLTAWFAIRQVIQAANFNHFHQAGLSATQFMTLNLLPVENDRIAIGELARRMNLKAATVAKTVDSLEARRLLKRTRSTADGRLVLVGITERGRTLQNAAAGQFRAHVSNIFNAMQAKDRAALIRGLESFVRVADSQTARVNTTVTPDDRAAPPGRHNFGRSPRQ